MKVNQGILPLPSLENMGTTHPILTKKWTVLWLINNEFIDQYRDLNSKIFKQRNFELVYLVVVSK